MTALPCFLCDEMLGRLARYLRAAGYDTMLATGGTADRDLLHLAAAEARYFLTLDRAIPQHKASAGIVFLLPNGDLDDLALAVAQRFALDWVSHAFTRCMIDNAPLAAIAGAQRLAQPMNDATTRDSATCAGAPMVTCPACRRVYWAGSHYRRMRTRLLRWQRAAFASQPSS